MDTGFTAELDKFLATLARLFAYKGASAEVAVLKLGRPTCEHLADDGMEYYEITLEVPPSLYNQVADRHETVEKEIAFGSPGRWPGV